ncbi:lipase family protein [Aureispira]|nr:lipase family protein [Aureispira sp.]
MKMPFLALLLVFSTYSFSQLREGFDPDEVKTCISMCNSYTFLDLYGSDTKILPKGYKKVYTSPVMGMDNKFQVYESGNLAVINFRGSTAKVTSWIENMYSAMVPAKGVITLGKAKHPYCFAKDTGTAVHSGYALAVVIMSNTIIEQIKKLNNKEIYNIIITGHSQGGALANLTRAYLENLPKGKLSSKNVYKTYAFANPMCGNKEFSEEFHARFCDKNMSYCIINPEDWVPQMPMHYDEEGSLFSKESLKDFLFGKKAFDIRKIGMQLVIRKFEKNLKDYINSSNRLIEKTISKAYGTIDMPDYIRDINYFQTGSVRHLQPFLYPRVKLDPSKLTEKQLEKMKPDANGNYYKQEPGFYQHKPYNYYVGFLKEYFSRDYNNLKMFYLPENL